MFVEGSFEEGWNCAKCTVLNENPLSNECLLCQEPRDGSLQKKPDKDIAQRNDSISVLGNLSFASWEPDRSKWTCSACTFVNDPRCLVCRSCGLLEGEGQNDLSSELGNLSLSVAQQCFTGAHNKSSEEAHERAILKERIDELIADDNKETAKERSSIKNTKNAPPGDAERENTRKQLMMLQEIQHAEKREHDNMRNTLEKWRRDLDASATFDPEQEDKYWEKVNMLRNLETEWDDKGRQIALGFSRL